MTSKRMRKKKKRQQAALQRVIDISERLGLYDAETEELDRLLAKRRARSGRSVGGVRHRGNAGLPLLENPDAAC